MCLPGLREEVAHEALAIVIGHLLAEQFGRHPGHELCGLVLQRLASARDLLFGHELCVLPDRLGGALGLFDHAPGFRLGDLEDLGLCALRFAFERLHAVLELGLEFPNLPYFIDGKFSCTESAAIMKYIAKKWSPDLLGRNAAEVAYAEQIFPHVMTLKGGVTGPCYRGSTHEEIIQANTPKLDELVKYLGDKQWLCGGLTYVDFIFAELLELLHYVWGDKLWEDYPTAKAYRDRFFAIEPIAAYCSREFY